MMLVMNAIDRLTEALDAKDTQIKKLESELETLTGDLDDRAWRWTRHVIMDSDSSGLPVPRLELEWIDLDDRGYNKQCVYTLVYKHVTGEFIKVPLGSTTSHGHQRSVVRELDSSVNGKMIDTPFRDGVHIINDSRQLQLPAYVIAEGWTQEIIPVTDGHRNDARFGPMIELDN